jgi:hypothetical protein
MLTIAVFTGILYTPHPVQTRLKVPRTLHVSVREASVLHSATPQAIRASPHFTPFTPLCGIRLLLRFAR